MNIPINEIINSTGCQVYGKFDTNTLIEKIYFDSRLIITGTNSLFLDLEPNKEASKRNQIDAINKGVLAILSAFKHDITYQSIILLIHQEPLNAIQNVATNHRKKYDIPIIGITGSNGKTIVKEWLSVLLSDLHICKNPASFNSQLGVPLSILELSSQNEVGIFEAGISEPDEMSSLHKIIEPTIGILTNIGDAHDAGFQGRHEKFQEKWKLFSSCNYIITKAEILDTFHSKSNYDAEIISWSFQNDGNVFISKNKSEKGTNLKLSGRFSGEFFISFQAPISIENTIHSILAAMVLGLEQDLIQKKIYNLQSVSMRMELKSGKNNCLLLDDTYNADLVSLQAALEFAMSQKESRNLSLVISDFKDLSPTYQKGLWEIINAYPIDQLWHIGSNSLHWKNGRAVSFQNTNELIKQWQKSPPKNSLIIVKGARRFKLEKIIDFAIELVHNTELTIHLDRIHHNLKAYRSQLLDDAKIMAVIKAGAYGSDSVTLGKYLSKKVEYIAIAYIDEGVQLRKAGITNPIMVMNPDLRAHNLLIEYSLEPEIISIEQLEDMYQLMPDQKLHIHLKFDTGMNRAGCLPNQKEQAIEIIKKSNWKIQSIFTHFHSSENPKADKKTERQFELYQSIVAYFKNHIDSPFMQHCCNSAAISRFPQYQLDMVRLGIGMYGISGDKSFQNQLLDVHSWTSYIAQVKTIKKGDGVGYNHSFTAPNDMKIAVVNVGYADGLPRRLSGKDFSLYIQDNAVPIIGNISMDSCVVDVSHLENVFAGMEVEIVNFSSQPIHHIAEKAEMIPYELLCQVGPRVRRIYVSE